MSAVYDMTPYLIKSIYFYCVEILAYIITNTELNADVINASRIDTIYHMQEAHNMLNKEGHGSCKSI